MKEVSNWKSALTSVLQELTEDQYKLLLEHLDKIPRSRKIDKSREEMPQIIIEHYGDEKSISVIKKSMEEIPRRDFPVQSLLRPFVDKRKREKDKNGKKRKHVSDSEPDEQPASKPAADQLKSSKPEKENNSPSWRKTIRDLKSSRRLRDTEAIVGKVMQKSGLRTYETRDDKKKVFFYVSVTDDTACVKVMVYGKRRYQEINEERSYLFRKLLINEDHVKVVQSSKVSETSAVKVPEEREEEARTLICIRPPVCSIAEAKKAAEQRQVSVEGIVTEIYPVEEIEVTSEQRKTKRQNFQLRDESDSIDIRIWGENTEQSKEISSGDVVRLTNVKPDQYHDTVSLDSTGFTRVVMIERPEVQNVRIEIIAIENAGSTQTFLEADFNGQINTFVVASQLLANKFNLNLDGDFRESLLDKIPFTADAEIQGRTIHKMQVFFQKCDKHEQNMKR